MSYSTISEMFLQSVEAHSAKPAYYQKTGGQWTSISYQEVGSLVERFAAGLASLGVSPGDKVAIQSNNNPRWAISDYAVACLGAVSVTVYPTLIAPQIKYILDDSDTQFVITEDQEQTAKILSFQAESPALNGIIAMDDQDDPASGVQGFTKILEKGDRYIARKGFSLKAAAATARPEDLLTLIYTSGTTGNPKGVMLSHNNLVSNIQSALKAVKIGPEDVMLSFLPLSHSFERMTGHYTAFSRGCTIYYAESVDTVGDNLAEVRPTVMVGVPRFYEKIHARVLDKVSNDPALRQRIFWWAIGVGQRAAPLLQRSQKPTGMLALKFKLADRLVFSKLKSRVGGRLRFFVSGGAPLSKEVGQFFAAANIPILEGYGLTETSPVITCNREELYKFGTVGSPIEGVEVKLAEDGEILCRGPNVMAGYYHNPEATREVIDEEGWFHSGDIGEFDEDGYLKVTDRKKSLLVTSGGKNVAPAPLEIALTASKYIEQALVVGDKRNFISALLVPAFETLEEWAAAENIPGDDHEVLCKEGRVLELYQEEVQRAMEKFSRYEQVKKFSILPREWTIESGESTPKLSVKRKVVEQNYAALIDELYAAS